MNKRSRVVNYKPHSDSGTWTVLKDIDMCGQGDKDSAPDWKKTFTID